MHSNSGTPLASVTAGSATDAGMSEASTRMPTDALSTNRWSTVTQLAVPGAQRVTVANAELIVPAGPVSTTSDVAFSPLGAGAWPPPTFAVLPPPHASSTAVSTITTV